MGAKELIKVLRTHPEESERVHAALDLASFPEEEVVASLVEALEKEESRAVQEAIVSSLILIGSPKVVSACLRLLRSEDAYVRNAAVEILQTLREKALRATKELLKDPDPDVRIFAVNVLGELSLREAVGLLREVIAQDPEVNVVAAAIEYLGELGTEEADREVIQEARGRFSDPYLDYAARVALGKIGGFEPEGLDET